MVFDMQGQTLVDLLMIQPDTVFAVKTKPPDQVKETRVLRGSNRGTRTSLRANVDDEESD